MSKQVTSEELMALLTSHQRRLIGFLRPLVPNRSDAEEILQDVNLYIWQHADQFERGTNFAAWALKIAHFCVLTSRKRQLRDRLLFDDALLERLATTAHASDAHSDQFQDALETCLQKLRPREHDLISQLYGDPLATPEGLAKLIGRSVNGLYVSIHRIRTKLLDCIQRTIAVEERG